jgi:hypothetical protein
MRPRNRDVLNKLGAFGTDSLGSSKHAKLWVRVFHLLEKILC